MADDEEFEMMDFEYFSVYDRMTLEKGKRFDILRNLLVEELLEEEGPCLGPTSPSTEVQDRGVATWSLAMQSSVSWMSSLPPLPVGGLPPILSTAHMEELLGPAFQEVLVLTEIFVSTVQAVGGYLGALGFAIQVLGPTVALARLLGQTATARALGAPNQDRSLRMRGWSERAPCSWCQQVEQPVGYFLSCCLAHVCSSCAFGEPFCCRCDSMGRAVPLRPQYWPLPERSLPLLRHPRWQIYSISEEPNFIIVRYFMPEDVSYSRDTTGVRYSFDFFVMEGARWTECISGWCTAGPDDQEVRIHFTNPSWEERDDSF